MRSLNDLPFDNTYARLPEAFYARVAPEPLSAARLVSFNPDAAALLDLDPGTATDPAFVEYFGGGRLLPGADPVAMAYAGHQFGLYVPRLGDGRALLLGEVRNSLGEKWDLHLKGSGKTPFSRGFDGRAVLRSTIREYLCSEAVHALGIPTTRALCVVGSDVPVYRETVETAATLVRLAPSHVRLGSFEFFYHRNQHENLTRLADYCIDGHFPELSNGDDRYPRFLREVVLRTARLIARWQAAGFAHGVMNTDNFSVLGITLDYGPFGFLDDFDWGFVPNHSDDGGRYAFGRQPAVGLWNLTCFARSLFPLLTENDAADALDSYEPELAEHYGRLMCDRLGLRERRPEDAALLADVLEVLSANGVDYPSFFRALGGVSLTGSIPQALSGLVEDTAALDRWLARYRDRLRAEASDDRNRAERMNSVNPKYVLRTYLAQQAIVQATEHGDFSEIERLLALLRNPFAEQPLMERYAAPPPPTSRHIVLSCSS